MIATSVQRQQERRLAEAHTTASAVILGVRKMPLPFTEEELSRLSIVSTNDGLNHMVMRPPEGEDGEPMIVGTAFVNIGIDERIKNLLTAAPVMFQHIQRMEYGWTALATVGEADPALAKLAEDMALSCRMALEWAANGVETLRNKIAAEDRSKRIDKPNP